MSSPNETGALRAALAYHASWQEKDVAGVMALISDDVVCDAPAGRIEGAGAYRGFLETYFQILEHSELLAAHGDDRSAILVLDNHTTPVASAPSASHYVVADGKIDRIRLIFDRAPYEAAARARAA
jgi:ketosteroid isomerase-like protein